jgi:acetylornithine deacetylase
VDFVTGLRARQAMLEKSGARDEAYDVPYSTIHAGKINGGVALNIVPNACTVDFEIRNVPVEDPAALMEKIRADANAIVAPLRHNFSQAEIQFETTNSYPGLDARLEGEASKLAKTLAGNMKPIKVSFGTEGGLYQERLRFPTLVCGPGFMEQGHKPDEFISREQIERCDTMMETLVNYLTA